MESMLLEMVVTSVHGEHSKEPLQMKIVSPVPMKRSPGYKEPHQDKTVKVCHYGNNVFFSPMPYPYDLRIDSKIMY